MRLLWGWLACALVACSFDTSTLAPLDGSSPLVDDSGVVIVTDAVVSPDVMGESDWFDDGYGYRRRLTFTYDPSTNLDEIPLAVLLDASRIDYDETQNLGQDLLFVDAANENLLSHEIEDWNEAGQSVVWVKIPRLSAAGDFIWMYYGDATADDRQQASDVWSNGYVGVWHLSEASSDETSTTTYADSTGKSNTGTQNNNANTGGSSIGGAQNFDGSDDYISVDGAGLQLTGTQITLEARARVASSPNQWPHVIGGGSDGRYWQMTWDRDEEGWDMGLRIAGARRIIFSGTGSSGVWQSLAMTYDGAALRGYIGGQEIGQVDVTGNLDRLNTDMWIGANPGLSPREFDGDIDEVRISNVHRSEDWLQAQARSTDDRLIEYGPKETR